MIRIAFVVGDYPPEQLRLRESHVTLVEQQVGAILVSASSILSAKRDQILSRAARFALPTMFAYSALARAG